MAKRTRILRTNWVCPFCETQIDGLIDVCPTCGKSKPKDIVYKMDSNKVEISEQELKNAGINKEECDGKHKDWVCDFCFTLNNYSDEVCANCGSPKTMATEEYGGDKINTNKKIKMGEIEKQKNEEKQAKDFYNNINKSEQENYFSQIETNKQKELNTSLTFKDKLKKNKGIIIGSTIALGLISLCCCLFAPIKETTAVSGFSWDRNIIVEEYKTLQEKDYDVPAGGRVYFSEEVQVDEEKVVDYYETVEVEKTRTVQVGTEEQCEYYDGGNGTTIEECEDVPVYGEEAYTVTEEQPVYKYVPIFDTLYHYEIERWVNGESYPSSGQDKEPYWNENYTLKENERDTLRCENYIIHYENGDELSKSFEEWNNTNIGDKIELTKNRLGIVYGD